VLAGAVRAARRRADAEGRAVRLDDLLTAIAPTDMRRPAVVRSAALHEAGHAVLALRLGLTVVQVSIMPDAHSGGATTIRVDDPTPNREALERQVMSTLAGRAADVVLGGGADAGSGSDLREATRVVAATHAAWGLGDRLLAPLDHDRAEELLRTDLELTRLVERDLQRLQWAAEWLAKANAAAILALADALLDARVLTGAEVRAIVEAHPPRLRVRAGSSCSSIAATSRA
jgi:ATP-dependent Zn protease